MSITNADLASVNENLRDIRDYSEKLEALDNLKKYLDSKSTINKSIKESGVKTTAVGNKLKGVIQTFKSSLITTIKDSADKLDKTLNTIFKDIKVGGKGLYKTKAEQLEPDKALSATIVSPLEVAKSAVVSENDKVPEFESPEIVKALDNVAILQRENNKLFDKFIKTEQKTKQDKNTEALVNKPVAPVTPKEKKEKVEKPKFPFNFKQFMGGLGKILKGILNPVSLIIAFVTKTLPYVLIAIAFLKGFWQGIGEELREKFTILGKKILVGLGIIFGLFKGGPILIRVLTLAYHALRISCLLIEHTGKMLLLKIKMAHETETFAEEKGLNIFKRGLEFVKFLLEKAFIGFKILLEVAKFVLVAAAAVLVVGLFILLIAGIFLLFYKFGDYFIAGIKKIISIFLDVGKFIINIFSAIPRMIIDGVLSLFSGLSKWIFGDKDKTSVTPATQEQQINTKSEVTFGTELKNEFQNMLKSITEPLNTINKAVQFIAAQTMYSNLMVGGMTGISQQTIRTMASVVSAVTEENDKKASAVASDLITTNNNFNVPNGMASDIDTLKKDITNMKGIMADLYELMDNWHKEGGNTPFMPVRMTRR